MPKYVCSVDPGVTGCGVATWCDGVLVSAEFAKAKPGYCPSGTVWAACSARDGLYPLPCDLVIECPRVYPGKRQKGDPNDLITLAVVVGRIAAHFDEATLVYPFQWKGQLPKDVCAKRVLSRLTPAEVAVISKPRNKRHLGDVMDAVGIGLAHTGRGL